MQSASYIPQPKVNPSLQNPSALHTECIGAEACIHHCDKHLTLQEHMRSLLKLLIALNTFSYCGCFATNCLLVGRCSAPRRRDSPFVAVEGSVVVWQSLPTRLSSKQRWPEQCASVDNLPSRSVILPGPAPGGRDPGEDLAQGQSLQGMQGHLLLCYCWRGK